MACRDHSAAARIADSSPGSIWIGLPFMLLAWAAFAAIAMKGRGAARKSRHVGRHVGSMLGSMLGSAR